ncbi:MAG: SRPBCC family protein, partial [Bacteroidales bacterium]|nr:SRPBCC family protein [Bacteroidales bacterium]
MKILKKLLIALIGMIAIALAIALILPKEFTVEREVTINKPKVIVFQYLIYLENQDDFSTWMKLDPQVKKEYRGEDGTVGFISAWESEQEDVGKGEQEIMRIENGVRIEYELRFIKPFEATNSAYMETIAVSASETTVKWGFSGEMP